MIPFLIGDKEIEIPTHHGEIKLRQFLVLRSLKETDFDNTLAILTGLSIDEIYSCNSTALETKILPVLDWTSEEFDYTTVAMPVKVRLGKKYFNVPSVYESTYGQKVVFKQIFDKCMKEGIDFIDCYDEILAIYFFPLIRGKFTKDYLKDQYVMDMILNMRIDEALPVASFFLSSFSKLMTQNTGSSVTTQSQKRSARVLTAFKSSVLFRPFIPLRKISIKALTKFLKWITTRFSRPFSMNQKATSTSVN